MGSSRCCYCCRTWVQGQQQLVGSSRCSYCRRSRLQVQEQQPQREGSSCLSAWVGSSRQLQAA